MSQPGTGDPAERPVFQVAGTREALGSEPVTVINAFTVPPEESAGSCTGGRTMPG